MSHRRARVRSIAMIAAFLGCLGSAIGAQTTGNKGLTAQNQARPVDDPEFARLVKEWTTRPDFISPLVDHLPKAAGVPSPKDILGHHIGEPKKLTYYADILKYYRALAAATPRVRVISIGASNEGRDLVV